MFDKLEYFYRLLGLKDKDHGGVKVDDDSVIKKLLSDGYKQEYAHDYSNERVEDPSHKLYHEYPYSAHYTKVEGNIETNIHISKYYTYIPR